DLAWTLDGIAGRYEKAKKYDEARSIYQKIVTDYPESNYAFTAQKKLTILEITAGDDAAAQQALDTLIADFNDNPGLPEALFSIAERYLYNNNCPRAIELWEFMLIAYPECHLKSEILYLLATCFEQLKDYLRATEYYTQVVNHYPNSEHAYRVPYRLGIMYRRLKDYDQSVYFFGQQRKLYSNESLSQHALFFQGIVYLFNMNEYVEAAAVFEEYVELYPETENAPLALSNLATCHEKMDDEAMAIALLQAVLSIYPETIFAKDITNKLKELQEGVKQ
ncbi:MAG: tetratricopeptide repeat protein, partial [Phycisphaerae bacterium]|nr:tetratricopeptide repeat protein [Phycisphaerae bacterium]